MQWASQSFNNNELIIQSLDNDKNSFGEEFSGPIAESIENTLEIKPHSSSLASRLFSSARRLGVTEQQGTTKEIDELSSSEVIIDPKFRKDDFKQQDSSEM